MATLSWSSGNQCADNVTFRAWGLELSTLLQSMAGLVKTADTGQIDWATVNRPGSDEAYAGYEIYYLNDSFHATSPIYFKLNYGIGANNQRCRIDLEVGTGSNGAGTLTGTGSGYTARTVENGVNGSATAQPSYMCVKEGLFWLAWKSIQPGFMCIARTCSPDGSITGDGALVVTRGASTPSAMNSRSLRFAAPASASPAAAWGTLCSYIPQNQAQNATDGSDYTWPVWCAIPDMRPMVQLVAVADADLANGTKFVSKSVGSAERTFLKPGTTSDPAYGGLLTINLALLWE